MTQGKKPAGHIAEAAIAWGHVTQKGRQSLCLANQAEAMSQLDSVLASKAEARNMHEMQVAALEVIS